MLSKLKRFGNYKSGGWFYKYHTSQLAMEKSHEYLRPATLKSGGDTTRIDDEGKAILRAAEDALLSQSEQADLLSVAPDDDIAQWPLEEVSQLLRTADLVDADEFDELTAKMLRSLARDFVAVLRGVLRQVQGHAVSPGRPATHQRGQCVPGEVRDWEPPV